MVCACYAMYIRRNVDVLESIRTVSHDLCEHDHMSNGFLALSSHRHAANTTDIAMDLGLYALHVPESNS